MPKRLHLGCLPLSIAAAFGAADVSALGFARTQPTATLGAPLDFAVGVRLDPAEVLMPECVSAEVWVGDSPVSRGSVGAVLLSTGGVHTIRVRTTVTIDEPVVTVNVTAGCESKISRRYTLFADPPGVSTGVPTVLDPDAVPATLSAAAAPAPAKDLPSRSVRPAQARASVATSRPVSAPRARGSNPTPASGGVPDSTVRAPASTAEVPIDRSGAGARLRLDAPSVTVAADLLLAQATEQRLAALQALRLASEAAQSTASSASTRVSAMEASLETLKRESQANREVMGRLQQRLAEADQRGYWTPWLLGAVLVMLGIAGWLYARLKRSEAERQKAWWNSSQVADTNAGPGTGADASASAAAAEKAILTPAVPAAGPAGATVVTPSIAATADRAPDTQITQALPAGMVVPDAPLRDVSIEELLDVEQQAEFFVVLGQDDAAIDLLNGHLRSAGGASALPYLKLLEIHHRRGDQAAYERMRRRFNDRFQAAAPDWATGPQQGRTLEDYPEVMARIQRHWPRPADAMAELETLLFRTESSQLFGLPAYRDVLFLFTLARDLQEMVHLDGPDVDVLLPMPHSADFEDTGAGAYVGAKNTDLGELELTLQEPAAPAALSAEAAQLDSLTVEPQQPR